MVDARAEIEASWRTTTDHRTPLTEAIEVEVVPRMLLAHRARRPRMDVRRGSSEWSREVVEFAQLVLDKDVDVLVGSAESLLAQAPFDRLLVDLLGPTARYLHGLWCDDLCDFSDVTVAVGKLQQVLRRASAIVSGSDRPTPSGRRILLAAAPGEQHTFGLLMVAEFFDREGWEVAVATAITSADDLVALVRDQQFDMVGISASNDRCLAALGSLIRSIRRASCSRDIGVMVGGQPFVETPELVGLTGADATATNGRLAPGQADASLALLKGRGPARAAWRTCIEAVRATEEVSRRP